MFFFVTLIIIIEGDTRNGDGAESHQPDTSPERQASESDFESPD